MNALLRRFAGALFATALSGGIAAAASDPPSPFERPPGLSDGDWKALSSALAKNVVPGQTLRPQDEASFGQGDGSTFMRFGRALAVSGTTLVVGAPDAVACVLASSSCGGGVGATYVYERVAGNWQFRQKLQAGDFTYSTTTNRNFGASVAIDGDTLLVGAGGAFDQVVAPNNSIGAVYVFTRTAGTWTQTQKLLPPTPVLGTDEFGFSVALSGTTAVIGNPGRTVSGAARAGAVHVFTRTGGTFAQAALLTAADGAAGNRLGESVAYSGNTILAGAPLGDAPTPADSGAAYVFTGAGATWTEQAKLVATDPLANARFGNAVDLDGDSAVIGAVGWTTNQGKAYVFVRAGAAWSQQQRLEAGDTLANRLGASVSIRGDTVAVGAPDTRGTSGGSNSGAVRMFTRSGTSWSLEQSLPGPDQSNAGFGITARLFDDGGTPALLASTSSNLPGTSSGIEVVRTYRRTGSAPTPFVLAGDTTRLPSTTQAFFGAVVAVDGDLAVVGVPSMPQPRGAPFTDVGRVGTAYVYARSGSQWTLRQALTITPLGGDSAAFGAAVAISGNTIAIGAPNERATQSGSGTGAAYVYTVGPSSIDLQQRIAIDGVSGSNNAFGRSLSLDGDTLAVGAPFTSNPPLSNNFGRVFVYTRGGTVWTKQQEVIDANPPDGGTSDDFGNYVVLRGNAMVIGTRRQSTSTYVPYVAVATRSGTTWSIAQRILEPPGTGVPFAGGEFGLSLAWSGTTLAIGAARHGTEAGTTGTGRVYLYEGAPGSFALAQTLRQTDGTTNSTGSRFGAALALAGDRLLVAAPDTSFATGGGGPFGAAYAYERVGGSWRLAARLRGASPDDTTFGFSGPLTGSAQGGSPLAYAGEQAIVGIPRSNGAAPFSAQNVGAAAVYAVPRATTISLTANPNIAAVGETVSAAWSLTSPGGAPTGTVTVVSTSGETCTAAAAAGACTLTFARTGLRLLTAVYAGAPGFGQSRSASIGVQVGPATGGLAGDTPVIPPDFDTGGNELIGFGVAMNESLLVVGAPGAGPGSSEGRGAVYVFEREGATAPGAEGKAGLSAQKSPRRIAVLSDGGGATGHRFGQSVAVSADGSRIVVGAPAAGNGLGRALVFLRNGTTWADSSSPNQVLAPTAAAGETVQRFGEAVDVDATGNVVVGAPRTDRAAANDAGSAYLFDALGLQRAALAAATPSANGLFGTAVAIEGGRVAIGVPGAAPSGGSNHGAVATFGFDGTTATTGPVLVGSDTTTNHRFGSALALAGELLAIGAPGRNGTRGGGYVFRRVMGGFTEIARLTPDAGAALTQAGAAVAVNATTVLLGAPDSSGTGANGAAVSTAGAVAVFRRFDGNWTGELAQDGVLALAGANSADRFGAAVAATGSGVAVGAPFVDLAPVEGPVLADYGLVVPYRNVVLFVDGFEPVP